MAGARQKKKNAKNAKAKMLEEEEKARLEAIKKDREFIDYAKKAAEQLRKLGPYERVARENPKRPPGREVEIDE